MPSKELQLQLYWVVGRDRATRVQLFSGRGSIIKLEQSGAVVVAGAAFG